MYQIFLPSPALRPYIEHYWMLRSDASVSEPLREFIFVDGKADILFNFGVAYRRLRGDVGIEQIRMSNVDGQRNYPVGIEQTGAIDLIGIRFRPGGLSTFLGIPVHEVLNEVIDTGLLFGAQGEALEGWLYDLKESPTRQTALLDQFFVSRMQINERYALVQAIAGQLDASPGSVIQSVSYEFGYSIRSIDRFFRQVMGFSPKMYSRIVRLRRALKMLRDPMATSLGEIAFRSGYYDQAHFSHDFKAFTGHTPSMYQAMLQQKRNTPAPNLVQILQEPPASSG